MYAGIVHLAFPIFDLFPLHVGIVPLASLALIGQLNAGIACLGYCMLGKHIWLPWPIACWDSLFAIQAILYPNPQLVDDDLMLLTLLM